MPTYDPLATYRYTQANPANGWLISEWAAGQSRVTDWSSRHVRTARDGATELVLDNAPSGSSEPFAGGEIRSNAVATTGTFSWTAEVPDMVDGAVFGMFAYQADWARDPWLEFDLEFAGEDTSEVHLTVHMEGASGRDVTNLNRTVVDLGFDASEGLHTYDLTLTGTGAVFRADGRVIAYFSGADMPGGVWATGALRSYVDLWAADSSYDAWTGHWTDPGVPLVARVAGATVRPGDVGGAMPILGTSGDNTLVGGPQGDVVDGLAGNDVLMGGAGNDRLAGGAGDDLLFLDAGDDWLDGGAGIDWVRVVYAGSASVRVDLGNYWGSQGTNLGLDALRGIENAGGSQAADSLWGGTNANHLRGGGGNDWLDGRGGADTLVGGAGRDAMAGGADRDRDVFVFEALSESGVGSARDTIQQFVSGIDDLDLRLIDANSRSGGDQAFAWTGTRAAAHSAWTVSFDNNVVVRLDVTGDTVADFEVQLIGLRSLGSGDLML